VERIKKAFIKSLVCAVEDSLDALSEGRPAAAAAAVALLLQLQLLLYLWYKC